MRLFHRRQQLNLKAPVTGTHVDVQTVDDTITRAGKVKLAIKPTTNEVHSPVHGDVLAVSQQAIKLQALDGQTYWVHLNQALNGLATKIFDWQVRVGDSVSPMTLLGTLNINAIKHAHAAVLVTQATLTSDAQQREVTTGMVMQY